MSIREDWVTTEKWLLRQANSMGELLEQIRPYISSRLIDGQGWERLLECAGESPVTMAAFPFGFEIPLHDPRPKADFGVSLVGDSRTAAFFQERNRSGDAGPMAAGLAWLLDETDQEDSLLRRVIGRKMLLEYDVDLAPHSTRQAPGIFLYPVGDALVGDGRRFQDLGAVYDALVFASGWSPDAAERKHLEQVYRTLTPDTCIKAIGTFPSRERLVRIAITGFRKARDVVAFLERAGWPGQRSIVEDTVSFFEKRVAFAYLGVHFDIRASGVGPTMGLSFFAREQEWLKDIRHWTALIDGLREQGCALSEKLSELANWSTGSTTLLGKSGPYMLVRGIHHVKLVISEDRVEQAKAYVFFLMMCGRPKGGIAARETS
ncbi:MAG: hypothetical protein OXF47_04275 [Nitrospira sp.]|nr:hypothetical protein [Nitrospira sp.]